MEHRLFPAYEQQVSAVVEGEPSALHEWRRDAAQRRGGKTFHITWSPLWNQRCVFYLHSMRTAVFWSDGLPSMPRRILICSTLADAFMSINKLQRARERERESSLCLVFTVRIVIFEKTSTKKMIVYAITYHGKPIHLSTLQTTIA